MRARDLAGGLLITALLLALSASSASALTVVRSGVVSESVYFKSDVGKCSGASSARVALPAGAADAQVISPQVGAVSDDVKIVSVSISQPGNHPIVQWIAEGARPCPWDLGEEWSAEFNGRVEYKLPVRVILPRALGERMVAVSLNRAFESTFANATKVTRFICRKGQLAMRCRVGWFIGDTSYRGAVSVQLRASPATPFWSYRLRVKVRDDYCHFVLHRQNCLKQVRRQKRGLRLGWDEYERWAS